MLLAGLARSDGVIPLRDVEEAVHPAPFRGILVDFDGAVLVDFNAIPETYVGGFGISSRGCLMMTAGPPVLLSLSPPSAQVNGPTFTLHCIGTEFGTASVIHWNNVPQSTTYVSRSEITAVITTAMLTPAGDIPVKVVNYTGDVSGVALFHILP